LDKRFYKSLISLYFVASSIWAAQKDLGFCNLLIGIIGHAQREAILEREIKALGNKFLNDEGIEYVWNHIDEILDVPGARVDPQAFLPSTIVGGFEKPDQRGRVGVMALQMIKAATERNAKGMATPNAEFAKAYLSKLIENMKDVEYISSPMGRLKNFIEQSFQGADIPARDWGYSLKIQRKGQKPKQLQGLEDLFASKKLEQITNDFSDWEEVTRNSYPSEDFKLNEVDFPTSSFVPLSFGRISSLEPLATLEKAKLVIYLNRAFDSRMPEELRVYLKDYFKTLLSTQLKLFRNAEIPYKIVVGKEEAREKALKFLDELKILFDKRMSALN
jgi:hypothetical protein